MSKVNELEKQLERERNFVDHFLKDNQQLKKLIYSPLTKDEQLKSIAVEFGKFLILMNVKSVDYPNTYKTNCGMAPDMIIETMEKMFDRFIESKANI